MSPEMWAFLSDPDHQETLAWIGGGVMVVLGGLWTVFTYFDGRKKLQSESQPKPAVLPERRRVRVDTGFGAGGNVRIKGRVTFNQIRLPGTAIALAAAGLLLLIYAILNSGDRISVQGGNYVRDGMVDSQVTIQGGKVAQP
jgi:hypothetical protein